MFRRYSVVIALIFNLVVSGVAVIAQVPQEKVDTATIDKIKEEGLKRSQVMEILSYITDVSGPRLTGSPNIRVAQEWAKAKLTEWGLQDAHLEAWGPFGRGWSLEGFTAAMVKPHFSPLIAYPKAWSPSTNGTVRGEVVYLNAKTEADLDKYKGKLKGAIVMIAPARDVRAHFQAEGRRQTDEDLLRLANADPPGGAPQRGGFPQMSPEQRAAQQLMTKKWDMCYDEGAAVVLEPGRGDGGTIFVQSATMKSYPQDTPIDKRKNVRDKDAPPIIPQVAVAVEHYNRIIRMLAKGVPVQLEIGISSRYHDQDLMSHNVIAEIPGTDLKDEIVMLGAHFDSWHGGTGATDNAAGSAVCMEALRILQALGIKPRRTIRIGLWSGEEQGLLGSRAYVTEHFGRRIGGGGFGPGGGGGQPPAGAQQTPPQYELKPPHEKVAGYFNLDNGTGKVRGIYMQGNEDVRAIFRTWFAPLRELLGAGPALDPKTTSPRDLPIATLSIANTGGTDHLSFDAVGLPGFQFIQDQVEYDTRTHHSNMDVYDRIQEDDMRQAATIMAAFVYNTAMRDKKLPRKPLPGRPAGQAGQ
ncbi:MAG TPA: M20/M25/M40 family metallo-hydrolase [Blastocatellia bacterium]|nr:M20/M25/M40 family metallo-hydrolase [Blastocatellia bacterium]